MRIITRNALLVIAGLLVVLLALGALPGLVKTGDPYYVEATVAAGSGPAIDGGDLSERRFPYTFGALSAVESGADPARSESYYTGIVGLKGAFTHTPLDGIGVSGLELLELRERRVGERSLQADDASVVRLRAGGVGAGLGGRQGPEGVRKAALGEFSGFDRRSRPGRDRRFDVIGVAGLDEPRERAERQEDDQQAGDDQQGVPGYGSHSSSR